MPRSAWNWREIATVVVVALATGLVVYALDFASKLADVLSFLLIAVTTLAPHFTWLRWPDSIRRRITRAGAELVAVYLFTSLFLVLVLLPTPFPPHSGRWLVWKCTAVLCLAMALVVATVPSRDHHTPIAVSGTFVLLLVIGLGVNRWWPAPDMDDCGAAQIAVDTRLRAQVTTALTAYQSDSRNGPSECADSLSVVEAGSDLQQHLQTAVAPLAAVVTSDPPALRGLDGTWKNLSIQPDARARWRTLGLDRASVLLTAADRQDSESIDLDELADLRVGRHVPFDPVALAVMTTPTSRWTPAFPRAASDVSGRPCPSNLVLPTRSFTTCIASKAFTATAIVDRDGNPVGAPVLGVNLTFVSKDQVTIPTGKARSAAQEFLTWLDNNPGALGLQALTEPVADILAPLPKQNDLVRQEAEPRPVHVTVVLDASLSMGRATDPLAYGTAAPWRPAIEGLKRWVGADRQAAADRRSIVVAHTGTGGVSRRIQDPAVGRLGSGWPEGTVRGRAGLPRGETGLADALGQARRIAREHAQPGRRQLIILLTDGVNVFGGVTERPVPRSALTGVQVVVVRPGQGCAAHRALIGNRCRTSDLTGSDVAATVNAVVSRVREGRAW